MRIPRPQFPFRIDPFQGEGRGRRLAPAPEDGGDLKKILDLLDSLKDLRLNIDAHREEISKLGKKIGMMESAFDEFLESSLPGDDVEGEDKVDNLEKFFQRFIPVLDNLRFLGRAVEASGDEEWKKGILLFYDKLFKVFLEFGFELAAQIGTVFDPSRHEAVGTAAHPGLPQGTVAEVLLDGWTYKGRLLRFARVIIVKEDPEETKDPEEMEDTEDPEDTEETQDQEDPEDPEDPEDLENPEDLEETEDPEETQDQEDPEDPEDPGFGVYRGNLIDSISKE